MAKKPTPKTKPKKPTARAKAAAPAKATAPKQAAPKQAAPKQAAPKQPAPKAASKKVAAKKVAPKSATSNKTTVKSAPARSGRSETKSMKAVAKSAAKKATPNKTVTKAAPKTVAAKKPTPKKPTPKQAAAKKVTPKQASVKKPTPKRAMPKKAAISKPKTKAAPPPNSANVGRAPTGRTALADPGPAEVLGRITWLMLQSPAHKHMFLTDLEWRVLPPVLLKQFRLFRKDGNPIGYAAWAFLDDETDKRLRTGEVKLAPDQWRAGPHLWLLDLVAPFGGNETMVKEIATKVFKGKAFRTLMPKEDGTGMRAVEIGGSKTQK